MEYNETERVLWESKRKTAINILQSMKCPAHFVLVNSSNEDPHEFQHLTADACDPWMLGAAAEIVNCVSTGEHNTNQPNN